jgi:hypothetical protein
MEPHEVTLKLRSIVEEVIFGVDDEGFPNVKYKFKYLPAYLHVLGGAELEVNDHVCITITKEPKPNALSSNPPL